MERDAVPAPETKEPATDAPQAETMARDEDKQLYAADVCLVQGCFCWNVGVHRKSLIGCAGEHKALCIEIAWCLQPNTKPLACEAQGKLQLGLGCCALACVDPRSVVCCRSQTQALCMLETCYFPIVPDTPMVPSCACLTVACDPECALCLRYDRLASYGGRRTACMIDHDDIAVCCCVICINFITVLCVHCAYNADASF